MDENQGADIWSMSDDEFSKASFGSDVETSEEVSVDIEAFEIVDYIPKKILLEISQVSGMSSEELVDKIENKYSLDANNYVKIYIGISNFQKLSVEEVKLMKELYVAWKLYESLEQEDVSKDKKETLVELLKNINEKDTTDTSSAGTSSSNDLSNDSRYGKICLF